MSAKPPAANVHRSARIPAPHNRDYTHGQVSIELPGSPARSEAAGNHPDLAAHQSGRRFWTDRPRKQRGGVHRRGPVQLALPFHQRPDQPGTCANRRTASGATRRGQTQSQHRKKPAFSKIKSRFFPLHAPKPELLPARGCAPPKRPSPNGNTGWLILHARFQRAPNPVWQHSSRGLHRCSLRFAAS